MISHALRFWEDDRAPADDVAVLANVVEAEDDVDGQRLDRGDTVGAEIITNSILGVPYDFLIVVVISQDSDIICRHTDTIIVPKAQCMRYHRGGWCML